MSQDELLDLMVQTMTELSAILKSRRHSAEAKQKRREVEVIQQVLAAKRISANSADI